ncbi:MAG: hypothetical protein V4621_07880 [Pseudomonadota bacterium]
MTEDGADIIPLPVKFRTDDTERVLTVVSPYGGCRHERFTIDSRLTQVECRDCKAVLDPMFALTALAKQETRYHELHARYQDEMARLRERSRTKCEHCGEMTRISHR